MSEMLTKKLYSGLDIIGQTLSQWRVAAVKPYIKTGELVDLACGDNRLVRTLGFGKGVDIKDYGNVHIVLPNFVNLPFDDRSIDTVTVLAALNYFDEVAAVLAEVRRILKDDGIFIVTFLHKDVSRWWHKMRDRKLKQIAFSQAELEALLMPAGLHIAEQHGFMCALNQLYIIRKTLN